MNRSIVNGLLVCALVAVLCTAASLSITTKPIRTFERPEGEVLAIAFTADGRYICAGGDRGRSEERRVGKECRL